MRFSYGLVLAVFGFCLIQSCGGVPTTVLRATNIKTDKTAEDDSDMLMEPNEYSHVAVVQAEGHQIFPTTTEYDSSEQSRGLDSHSQAAQNFYPPFFRESPPLGHSRPYYPSSDSPITGGKIANSRSIDATILGSGDFGVIRGGTFYSDNEGPFQQDDAANEFNYFFGGENSDSNNGHGRPQAAPYVQKFTYPEEQFANFRDFADINTPTDPAYSQFVVVYANKNSTSEHPNPRNIFEQLELLDREKAAEKKKNTISKAKAKLANTKLEKKYKKKAGPKDMDYEPLLALS